MKKEKIEDMTQNTQTYASAKRVEPILNRTKLKQISLSDDCKSIIYGTLLGDGCLQKSKGYKNARLSIRHSAVQSDYFDWKVAKLQEELASPRSVQIQKPNGFSSHNKLLFQSRACEPLTEIMSITHHHNHLCIQRRWLNHLNALSLAIWWCDDGSIIANGRKGVLCTDGFDEASVRLLADYLQTVWGIYVHVGAIKRNRKFGNSSKPCYYRLWFSTTQLQNWLRIIMPSIPVASMLYKVILIYKHSAYQQRWISEVKSALPQFHTQIDALLQQRALKQAANSCARKLV
jgi:LAGLIDADG DNA endonuclease family